jgi:hypothetical protein
LYLNLRRGWLHVHGASDQDRSKCTECDFHLGPLSSFDPYPLNEGLGSLILPWVSKCSLQPGATLSLAFVLALRLRLVWRIVSRGQHSLKASLNQSCGGVALRRAEAGGD